MIKSRIGTAVVSKSTEIERLAARVKSLEDTLDAREAELDVVHRHTWKLRTAMERIAIASVSVDGEIARAALQAYVTDGVS